MARLALDLANVDCSVLRGHFLTRPEAATQAGMSIGELRAAPGVIQIAGPSGTEEAYPDFQFSANGGFVPGLQDLVTSLHDLVEGAALCGLLVAPQPTLGGESVIDWLSSGNSSEIALEIVDSTTKI